MARLWKSSLTPWCLLPPRVHVLLCGLCGWKVRPLWPSSALHCGRNLFFLLDGRGTDEPKPPIRHPLRMVWVAQTPHPSSVTDGIGGVKDPSVHCYGSNRDRPTDTDDGWVANRP